MKKLLIIIIHIIILSSCSRAENRKAAFIAGYYESSIIHYKFEMYPDSTFVLQLGFGEDRRGIWQQEKDTFLLFFQDTLKMTLGAKITNSKAKFYDSEFRILELMNLKTFSPPKIVQYPKN